MHNCRKNPAFKRSNDDPCRELAFLPCAAFVNDSTEGTVPKLCRQSILVSILSERPASGRRHCVSNVPQETKKIPFPLYFHHVFLTVCVYYLRRGCQCVCWCAVYSGILGGYFSFHNLHLSHTQSFPSPFLTVSTIAKGRG